MKEYFLKDICKLNSYKQVPASLIEELKCDSKEIALLPSSNDYGLFTSYELGNKYVCEGEVITIGRARYANIKYWNGKFISSNNIIIQSKDKNLVLTKYLYYYFLCNNKKVYIEKTTYPVFDKNHFNKLTILIPSIDEQAEIVAKLDLISEVIKCEEYRIQLYDELVWSKYYEMFGDPLDNPKRWDLTDLSNIGSFKNGLNFRASESGVEINCLGVGDFKDKYIINNTNALPTISLNKLPNEDYMLQNEDIVFVRSNGNKALVGRCIVVYPNDVLTTFSGFCIRFRKCDNRVLTGFLLYTLKTNAIRSMMKGKGSEIQNINQGILSALQIPLVPIELQKSFISFCDEVNKAKAEVVYNRDNLQELLNLKMHEIFI